MRQQKQATSFTKTRSTRLLRKGTHLLRWVQTIMETYLWLQQSFVVAADHHRGDRASVDR
eukprot:4361962-Prymnesium_polylepis.1